MEYRILTKYPGVYQRESGSRTHKGKPDVCFDISFKLDSKKVWEKIGWVSEGYSAKLAAELRAERLRSMRHGHELPKQKKKYPYFQELAKKYLHWTKENKKTGFSDEHRYRNHLAPRFDSKRLDEITSLDLERMKSDLSKKKLSPATVKHCLVLFRQMMNKAISWGMFNGTNPVKSVKMPVIQNQRERFLTYEEADTLLSALEEYPTLHDMSLLSLNCGLRAGEIFNLKGHDLDFQNEIITILDAKGGASQKVYMTEAVKDILKKRMPDNKDDYIFLSRAGDKYTEIPKRFRVIADTLFNKGVKDKRQRVTFHTLRHTFASWLALHGESLLTIRELLRHKSFQMTQRYAHLIPDEKRRAAKMLDKVFTEKRNENANKQENIS